MSSPRPPSIRALAWRQALRDFRAGELRLLVVAVMLAVTGIILKKKMGNESIE